MDLSSAVVGCLAGAGIDTVFGIPGGLTLPLNHAIDDHPEVRFVMARHETAVTHAAWGYAESSGRPAATLVVPGPGDLNASNGLMNALTDCNPIVHLAAETDPADRGRGAIHEAPASTYDGLVKANVTVESPASAVAVLDRAIAIARTPPAGPVRVGIPASFLDAPVPPTDTAGPVDVDPAKPPADGIDRAVDLLDGADRPVVIAGGGVRAAAASDALVRVAERLDAPVATTRKGKGVFPADHDLFAGVLTVAGSAALVELLATADAALGVGTDFDALTTRSWTYDVPDALVHVTMQPADLGAGYDPAVGLVADARATLEAIAAGVSAPPGGESPGADRARAVRTAEADRVAELRDRTDPPITSVAALGALRSALPRETVVTVDASGCGLWADATFDAFDPRDYLNQGSWATMGTAVPTAVGAAVAAPDEPVVAICGDGGLLMALHELHTIVAEGLDVLTIVLTNHDYAIISDRGEHRFGLDRFDWPDAPISFVSIAEGVGMDARRAVTPAAIDAAVETGLDASDPCLIEVPIDPTEPPVGRWFGERA